MKIRRLKRIHVARALARLIDGWPLHPLSVIDTLAQRTRAAGLKPLQISASAP